MKKFKLLLVALLGLSFLGTLAPLAGSSSTSEVISGASADLDYVYTDGDETNDVSDAAARNDGSVFETFDEDNEDSQYLYLGSESMFNNLFFNVEASMDYEDEDEAELVWEYNDGSSWNDLDVNADNLENFSKIGTQNVSFELPLDWDTADFDGNEAYWVRVRADGDIEDGMKIEQISARVFNVEVTVTTDGGSQLKNLTASNFSLGQGSDDRIYSFESNGEGTYYLALQTEKDDTDYMLAVTAEGYLDQAFNVLDVDTNMESYKVQLTPSNGCTVPFVDIDFHWAQTAITNLYCRGIIEGENGSFMVNHTITRAEFIKMALGNASIDISKYDDYSVPFNDVDEEDWYYGYVAAAYRLDFIDADDRYYPEGDISRVEALTLLVRMAGVETEETATRFSDISRSMWYASTVRIATDYDVVEGYPDGTFKPERNLSRAEAAVMVNNAYRAWVAEK